MKAVERKQLQYFSFGIHAEAEPVFQQRIAERTIGIPPHPLGDGKGLGPRDPDGTAIQWLVADKVSPLAPSPASPVLAVPPEPGRGPKLSTAVRLCYK